MGKNKDEKLEELIRLLKELLSKRSYRSRVPYRPKKSIPRTGGGGGYRPRNYTCNYPTYHSSGYRAEPKRYEAKERASSYSGKPGSEPMQYQPKERLVYDPEVVRLLQKIEKNLSSEPTEEEILKHLESNPELYDKISERLAEELNKGSYEQLEANEPESKELEKEPEENRYEAEPEVEGQAEDSNGVETNIEALENEVNDVAEAIENDSENLEEDLSEEELPEEQAQEVEQSEAIEPPVNVSALEPSTDVIEQIEDQDLSSLETELYQEPAEPFEPEIEPISQEEIDDQVFWQNAENEIIRKNFKKPEQRLEPEADEYGY